MAPACSPGSPTSATSTTPPPRPRPDTRSTTPTPWAGPHLVSSLLKRWTAGTLHYRLSEQHLPYYLDEFTFRFNRRTSQARGLLFYRLLQQSVDTDPHPLKDLIGGGS